MPNLAAKTRSASGLQTSDLGQQTIRKLFWRLLPFLFLVYVVNYLDRINVGFAALQMQALLGFSDRVYGLGAGIFFIGYLGLELPSNLALIRVGARRWIAAIMLAWGVISSCMIFVRTPHGFYGMRFLLGAAEAGFFPGIILYLKNWIPASARARGLALFMTGIPIAGFIGGPISGALLELHAGPLAGWQWLFLLEGAPAILLGVAALALLSESPQSVGWLTEEERSWLMDELQSERESHPNANQNWSAAFINGNVWLLTVCYFGLTTCMYGLVYFVPKIIRGASGGSSFKIGVLSMLPYAASAMVMVLVGRNSDRTNERNWHLAVFAFAGALGALATAYSNSSFATVASLSLAMAGCFATLGPFWALSASVLSASTAATGIAIINSLGNLGGFLGPTSVGLLRNVSGNNHGGMIVVATAALLAGALALPVRMRRADFPK